MIDFKPQLKQLVETSLGVCRSWLKEDSLGGFRLVDPIDGKAVASHYGDSHLAAALVILGKMRNDDRLIGEGLRLIETVVRDWWISAQSYDFHHDFNNFALCLIEEYIKDTTPLLAERIKVLVLTTPDSSHDTINWLPMRAYVNRVRYDWTHESRYKASAEHALNTVRLATNGDGGIEDRLPVGSSYNLQYNISSLAALQLMSRRWSIASDSFTLSLDFLIDCMLPDGDINYVGRGTNQIFAWGPWLYTLASTGEYNALGKAFAFLDGRYAEAIKHQNILLNDFPGLEKLFWWDYHFCSVYHAHFLLWTVLAMRDLDVVEERQRRGSASRGSTGLQLKRVDVGGAAIFEGRSSYLSEGGPNLCALWHCQKGILFKGGLGPWRGEFGKRYSFADTVFLNHFGLMSQTVVRPFMERRVVRRLLRPTSQDRGAALRPAFFPISIHQSEGALSIIWETTGHEGYLNIPILEEGCSKVDIEFSVDGQRVDGILVGKFKSQYGWNSVTRSHPARGRRWGITIR